MSADSPTRSRLLINIDPYAVTAGFKRVVPLYTGLLRLVRSSPFSGFLANLSKEEISVKRSVPGIPETDKGKQLPENGWEPNLVRSRQQYHCLTHVHHAWFPLLCAYIYSFPSHTAQAFLHRNHS
jgi:hypothetical protein